MTDTQTNRTVSITPYDQMVVNSGQLVRELVTEGVGFAIFPDFAINSAQMPDQVSNILPGWPAGERGFFAVHSASNAKLSVARSFVDDWKNYMAETCETLPTISAEIPVRQAFVKKTLLQAGQEIEYRPSSAERSPRNWSRTGQFP